MRCSRVLLWLCSSQLNSLFWIFSTLLLYIVCKLPFGRKGWRGDVSACLPPIWPGFKSRRRRHICVEFVVGFSPLLWEVFLQVLRFSPFFKNQHFQISIRLVKVLPLIIFKIFTYLLTYLFTKDPSNSIILCYILVYTHSVILVN